MNKIHSHFQSIRFTFLFILLASLIITFLSWNLHSSVESEPAYVDPILTSTVVEELSVIVTANDSQTAVSAITANNGQVNGELWLIDAASATIPASELESLARTPGVVSIVNNQEVKTAVLDPYAWEGWVTDRRNYVGNHPLSGDMWFTPVVLPDGSIFNMVESGDALILEMDGELRASFTLPGKPFRTPPAIGENGTIFTAGKTYIHALSPANGNPIWSTPAGVTKFDGGLALGQQAVFVTDASNKMMAYDIENGAQLWKTAVPVIPGDKVTALPTVGPDGTLYVVSEKGSLFALNPTNGDLKWTYTAPDGANFLLQPQVDTNGIIYLAGKDWAFAVNSNGTQKYANAVAGQILAPPALGADHTFYVPTDTGYLYAFAADGSSVFTYHLPGATTFQSTPALALDETTIYITSKDAQMLAINTANGNLLWDYTTPNGLLASPTVAPNGNIHVGDKGGNYTILNPDGLVVYRYEGFDQFRVSPSISQDGSVFFHNSKANIVVLARRPLNWTDQVPHVEPTNDPNVYKIASPLSIDLGADIAHENGVMGTNIGVAVIDSGVYFDPDTQSTLGGAVQQHFLGQADFVNDINCTDTTVTGPASCFSDYTDSLDGYGHGSHVAGIIWNNVSDYYTGAKIGIAPEAEILSLRVLDENGTGTYADVIAGIQYAVNNKTTFDIRVMNLSISAPANVPYFVDPLNRAVEEAWAAGIVVVAAAGNEGPTAQTITVPGNNPYVITVGAVDGKKTPGYWADDTITSWSSTGPTRDGFVKPDILVQGGNIVSYMYNDGDTNPATSNSPKLVQTHPDYSITGSMFRMNGTSMSTAAASGVVALMLDADPTLTPDDVKYRLMYSAKPAISDQGNLGYNPFQQGAGRIWVPDAIFNSNFPVGGSANAGMDINDDLAHGWMQLDVHGNPILDGNGYPLLDQAAVSHHYQGAVRGVISDDGEVLLYYIENAAQDDIVVLGAAQVSDMTWIDDATLKSSGIAFANAGENGAPWPYNDVWSSGAFAWSGGAFAWSGGAFAWSGGAFAWSGGAFAWSGGAFAWSGGAFAWSGSYPWATGLEAGATGVSSTSWVPDEDSSLSSADGHRVFLPFVINP